MVAEYPLTLTLSPKGEREPEVLALTPEVKIGSERGGDSPLFLWERAGVRVLVWGDLGSAIEPLDTARARLTVCRKHRGRSGRREEECESPAAPRL